MASHAPAGWMQSYCASKILTDFVSHGLNYELSEIGVDVCAWRPAGVATKLVPDDFKNDPMSVTTD